MAKKKSITTESNDNYDIFQEVAEKSGGEILDLIDSIKYFVDSGSLAINYICSGKFIGGGIPGAKLTEIYGPSSSAKSLLGANVLFGTQRSKGYPGLLDAENSANKEFIKQASHCDPRRIIRHTPRSLEQSFTKMYQLADLIRAKVALEVPITVLYDSIGCSPCERELREVDLPEEYTAADFKRIVGGHEQPGERAKICSREFRKLNTVMDNTNMTVVILNQIRAKIGGFAPMGMTPKTTAGGGESLGFYASCRLETKTLTKIEKKITAKKKKILGVNLRIKNVKNKTHRPFIESDNIQLLFDRGINPISGLLTCLLDAERIEGKGGNFVIREPWAGGEEIKFKASLDRNDIPLEVLYKCPALVDATSREQVEDYLFPFMDAINFRPEDDSSIELNDADENTDDEIDEELG